VRNTVRDLRVARGLSQAVLSQALNVSRQTINSIENDRYTPSLPLALAMARFFQTSVEEIFNDDGTSGHANS
jgi:putative transcriptional regulator